MTIAKLVIDVNANLAGLQRDLRRIQQFTNSFAQNVQRNLSANSLLRGLTHGQQGLLKNFTNNLVQNFEGAANKIRANFASGLITPQAATAQLAAARRALFAGIQSGLGPKSMMSLVFSPQQLSALQGVFNQAGVTAGQAFAGGLSSHLQKIGPTISAMGERLTRNITIPLLTAGGALVKFAAEAEIARARLDVVFGPAGAAQMVETLAQLRKNIPASTREIHNFAASFGEMLIPLGIVPRRAQEMSVSLIEVAKNISLIQKVPAERAFSALRSALVSQTRELRKLGVNVTEQDIKCERRPKGG